MAAQTFSLSFKGYWLETGKGEIPNESGLYCVYTCKNNGNVCDLKRLIYIGKSDEVGNRLANHEHQKDFEAELKYGEVLCYSFCAIDSYIARCEAALIYKHQPTVNTTCKESFTYDETTLKLSGDIEFLFKEFTVLKSL